MIKNVSTFKIFDGTRTVTVDNDLIKEYQYYVNVFTANGAECLLYASSVDPSLSNEELTSLLKKYMREEIEFGKEIMPKMFNGEMTKGLWSKAERTKGAT